MAGTGFEPPGDFTRKSGYQPPRGAESGAFGAQGAPIDLGLVTVIQAWPSLPEAIRAGILTMVQASS
jgi:hypothetical protein